MIKFNDSENSFDNINAIRFSSVNDIVTVTSGPTGQSNPDQAKSLAKFCRIVLSNLPHSNYVATEANSYYPTPICLNSSIYCGKSKIKNQNYFEKKFKTFFFKSENFCFSPKKFQKKK